MQTGEQREFERLYRSYYPRVAGYLARRLVPEAVDDAISEVFVIAWRKRSRIPSEPIGWLLGVAANVLARHYRGQSRFHELLEQEKTRASMDVGAEFVDDVADRLVTTQALLALTEKDREALLLIAWEDLSTSEAAIAAGCSPGAFRVRLTRARARLRNAIAAIDPHAARQLVKERQR